MNIGRAYNVTFDDIAVSAVQDMLILKASAGVPFIIEEIEVGQRGLSAWEAKPLVLHKVTGSPTIGTSNAVTPTPMDGNASAMAATTSAWRNNTTPFSGGTDLKLWSREFVFLNGFFYLPAPEDRLIFPVSSYAVLQLPTAPSGSTNMSLSCTFREIG